MLSRNLVPQVVPVCNNATWALGEIALQMRMYDGAPLTAGGDMAPYLAQFTGTLVHILNTPSIPKTLQENTGTVRVRRSPVAITLGRLGLACPREVAPLLPTFIHPWCVPRCVLTVQVCGAA